MAAPRELQRSIMTFRRSGSSGLVWEEYLSMNRNIGDNNKESGLRRSYSAGNIGQMTQNRSPGFDAAQPYRANRSVSPVVDPPSPKISVCGVFGMIFRKSGAAKGSKHLKR